MNLRYRTIVAVGEKESQTREGIAYGSAIYPGQLVELVNTASDTRYSDGDQDIKKWAEHSVQLQSTASVAAEKAVVMENDYLGLGVETAIAQGDKLRYYVCEPGDVINFRFTGALSIAKGTKLEPDGSGGLKAYTTAGGALFVAEETINPGGGVSNLYRIRAL